MRKINKKYNSIRFKLFITLAISVVIIILFLIVLNNIVLESFYLYTKQGALVDIFDEVNKAYNTNQSEKVITNVLSNYAAKSNYDIIKTINSVDLLIIDDLGSETKNNLKLTELFNIINTRLLNQNNKITKTIISTNLSLQDLYNTYEETILSRIIGKYEACYFFGDDIRIKKKIGK